MRRFNMEETFNITKAKYYNNLLGNRDHIIATIEGEEMHVPIDENNRHYKAILAWVEEGNEIEAAE